MIDNLYIEVLRRSFGKVGNNVCLGLDPQWHRLPAKYRKQYSVPNSAAAPDCNALRDFLEISLQSLQQQGLCPAAFKPNLGYFQSLNRPLCEDQKLTFGGSHLLAWLYCYLSQNFPDIPIILDFKKGDIARSSANYAEEGFALWRSDAVSVSPYMGADSISPFGLELRPYLAEKNWPQNLSSLSCNLPIGSAGVYSLLCTSNPGGRELQNLTVSRASKSTPEKAEAAIPLYLVLAKKLLEWRGEHNLPGLGAVVGATSLSELQEIALIFADKNFPLLIPGVGAQGGSFRQVQQSLQNVGYPLELARINLSSGLLQSWNGEAPTDWPKYIGTRFSQLL